MCQADYKSLEAKAGAKYIETFLFHLKYDRDRSPETIKAYRKDLYHFGSCLVNNHGPGIMPKKVAPLDVWLFLRHLSLDHGYRPRSRARNLASLKSFFKFLKTNGYVKKDPTENIQLSLPPDNQAPVYFSVSDFKQLIAVIDTGSPNGYAHWVLIHVLFLTGMRISEVLSLQNQDVDLEAQVITVHQGKGRKTRIIPVAGTLLPVLTEYKKRMNAGPKDWFFGSRRSASGQLTPQGIRLCIKRYCRAAGITKAKMSPHVFRHGFATTLYRDLGVDLLRIAALLGHSSTRTTEIYAHTSEEHLRSAVDLICFDEASKPPPRPE